MNATAPPLAEGDQQELRPGPGARRRRLRGPRRRGGRPGRRQRRRQVDTGQDDLRASTRPTTGDPLRRQQVTIDGPSDATELGIATVYQDLALCDNLDVVANLFLGRGGLGSGPASASLDEAEMEQQAGELLSALAVTIPSVRTRGRHALRRSAPAGRGRPLAARRAEGRDAGRADRGARRAADRAGAGS